MKKAKLFYSTGIKIIFSWFDIIKFKLRLADYDDTYGIRYSYLISLKIFNLEFFRIKYRDQKGKIYFRKVNFGG